jgi:hypothetical protein
MTTSSGISNLVAAELSQAAYDTLEPANLPQGWTEDLTYYGNSGGNSFSTFVNAATQQVVIAFRGTTTLAQLQSDVSDQGGAEWEAIKGEFASVLASVQAALPGYQIMTDGHSLGGGMAQTAALEFDLSGYGQNALPISPDAITDINNANAGGLNAALAAWKAGGNTFSEATIAGDITTIAFAGDLDLYTNSTTAPNTSTTTLSNTYAGLERDGLELSLEGNKTEGAAVTALAEEAAHGIGNVIAELQGGPVVATVPVAFLLTDETDLNAIAGGFDIADSAALIAAGFNSLEADAGHIQSISFTDAGTPTLALTAAEAAADANLLPKIAGSYDVDVVGVTGQSYYSYQQDYVDGLYDGVQYLSTDAAGASYSLLETDYNYAGAYSGETRITADIAGESFTGKALHYDAAGELRSKTLTGVTGQSYTSITYDYTKSGASAGVTEEVTDAPGESYFVGDFHYGASGGLRWESAELENGGLQITGEGNGVQLAGQGDDVFTGGGSRATFALGAIFGADTITDFASHDSGAGHDKISLSRSDFTNFSALLSAATNTGAGVLIAAPDGQTLTIDGIDTTTLAGLSADFSFHGKG